VATFATVEDACQSRLFEDAGFGTGWEPASLVLHAARRLVVLASRAPADPSSARAHHLAALARPRRLWALGGVDVVVAFVDAPGVVTGDRFGRRRRRADPDLHEPPGGVHQHAG
jgi:hypothetical protein